MQICSSVQLSLMATEIQPNIQIFCPHFSLQNYSPVTDNGVLRLKLEVVSFNDMVSLDDALKSLKEKNLRPASINELRLIPSLAGRETRDYILIAAASALSDVANKRRYVPGLVENSHYRIIGQFYADAGFSRGYRFLAIES